MSFRFWMIFAALALALSFPAAAQEVTATPPPDLAPRIQGIVEAYRGAALPQIWKGASALERLGDVAIEPIEQLLSDDSPMIRLMASKALFSLGEWERLTDTLLPIVENDSLGGPERCAAIRMLRYLPSDPVDAALGAILSSEQSYDASLKIAAASSLSRNKRSLGRDKLVPLLEVDDPLVREQAALALSDLGSGDPRVRRILKGLKYQPSAEGDLARALLFAEELTRKEESELEGKAASSPEVNNRLEAMRKQIEERDEEIAGLKTKIGKRGGPESPVLLFDQLLAIIRAHYVDPERYDKQKLLVAAAKGMIGSLDPFSSFMDYTDMKEFNQEMSGDYVGIGAELAVDTDSGNLEILRPLYQGPAYKAGLRSGDQITEIDGVRMKGLSFDDMVVYLRGKSGSSLRMKIGRRGWLEDREFVIERQPIHIQSVLSTCLPGNIGYITVSRFGDSTSKEFEEVLDALEKQRVSALIIDLRDNTGGYLNAAAEMVDTFVGVEDRPIVSQKSKAEAEDPNPRRSDEKQRFPGVPLAVLINHNSASASEIVAGALQDYRRATLIGERSFGKGSVQRLIPIDDSLSAELGGESKVRLTIHYYFLPSGRSIHTFRDEHGRVLQPGGIQPDIEVTPEEIPLWRLASVDELARTGAFGNYLEKYLAANRDALTKLADQGDGWSVEPYPNFREFFAPLNRSNATDDDIRFELRRALRRKVADERGSDYSCDFAEDRQLQRTILELLAKLGSDPRSIPQYALLPGKFAAASSEKPKSKR